MDLLLSSVSVEKSGEGGGFIGALKNISSVVLAKTFDESVGTDIPDRCQVDQRCG